MKRPSFIEGVGVAFTAALAAGLGLSALAWLLSPGVAAVVLTTVLSGAYLVYMLVRSPDRVGRAVSLAVWLLATGSLWALDLSLTIWVLTHLGMLSLLRSLYFHARPLATLGDLGLTGVASVVALGAYLHTGSAFLTVWCLFLVQALWVLIPSAVQERRDGPMEDPFERAHRNAETALRNLATNQPSR